MLLPSRNDDGLYYVLVLVCSTDCVLLVGIVVLHSKAQGVIGAEKRGRSLSPSLRNKSTLSFSRPRRRLRSMAADMYERPVSQAARPWREREGGREEGGRERGEGERLLPDDDKADGRPMAFTTAGAC